MTPKKISLHNFLSYTNPPPLDFSNFDLAVIVGENGAGKSTILEALTWAIWEKTRGSSSDDLIHQGENSMWVDFVFEHEGESYRIFRRRDRAKHGTSTLEFQIKSRDNNLLDEANWKSISEGTMRATQEKIVKTLKLPYEIFTNTSYLRQGKADEFTIKTPAERKAILSEILGLDDWEILEEKTKEKIKNYSIEKETLNYQIENFKNQTAEKNTINQKLKMVQAQKLKIQSGLEIFQKKFQKLDEQKKTKDVLDEKIDQMRRRAQELNLEIHDLKTQKKENIDEAEDLKKIIAQKNNINKKYTELKDAQKELLHLQILQEKYQTLKEKLILFRHREQELKNKLGKLQQISTCPTCLRPMKKEEAQEIILSLKKEYLKNSLPQKKIIEENLAQIKFSEDKFQKIRSKVIDLLEFEEQKRNLDIANSGVEKLQKQNLKLSLIIEEKTKILRKMIEDGKKLQEKIKELEKIIPNWKKISDDIERSRSELLICEGNLGALKQAIIEVEKIERELLQQEKRQKEIINESALLNDLQIAFSKNGIQAMIIEQSIPAIEEIANQILQRASNERMSLRFITQRQKKSAEDLIETLEIKIRDEQGERAYELFSGGEAFRINFSIRVALAKFLAARSGIHLKFLGLDEGFGTLDSAGREDLVATINAIRQDFAKILVITHIQELKDLFPTQILVTKTENGSKIEINS